MLAKLVAKIRCPGIVCLRRSQGSVTPILRQPQTLAPVRRAGGVRPTALPASGAKHRWTHPVDPANIEGSPPTGAPMRVVRITTNLHVADIEAAKGFYTDFLGLSTEEFNLG